MAYIDLTMRACPFCGETIQADAIKCRYCREFLNTDEARALEQGLPIDEDQTGEMELDEDNEILFSGRPSLWGMTKSVIKGLIVLALAILVAWIPVEKTLGLNDSSQATTIAHYKMLSALGIGLSVFFTLIIKAIRLKTTCYEITPDRIEWSRGIVDRKVDNLDMFRVVDLKLRRSLLDCLCGVGTVALITNDKSDPEFVFEKLYDSRRLYDVIKKASLEADRKTGVVHLE